MSDLTAPQLAWMAAGRPAPSGKTGSTYRFVEAQGVCACCAGDFDEAQGVPVASTGRGANRTPGIENPTYSNHGEFLRWGKYVCAACAWLHGDPKRTHRSLLVAGGQLFWPALAETTAEGRGLWAELLPPSDFAPSGDAPWTGILTTDPKPRLWPRMRVATFDKPGLYLHAPDYDVSAWSTFDWSDLAHARALVRRALIIGITRREMMTGLTRPLSDLAEALTLEDAFAALRGAAELVIAVLVERPVKKAAS